jgi:hypothetical protein
MTHESAVSPFIGSGTINSLHAVSFVTLATFFFLSRCCTYGAGVCTSFVAFLLLLLQLGTRMDGIWDEVGWVLLHFHIRQLAN